MEAQNNNTFNSIIIKESKTGHPIPVINNVHLHSIYNPEREADGFVGGNESTIKTSKQILIFGLGFAYHIERLEREMTKFHQQNYEIFVIEPNTSLYKSFMEKRQKRLSERVKVFCFDNVKEFYQQKTLVEFLSNKPAILPHPASFQLNEGFFKSFMSFHYPNGLKDSLAFIEGQTFKNYIESFDSNLSTEQLFEEVKSKPFIKENDFLILALSEMVSGEVR